MNSNRPAVFVVVPAYNEATRIRPVLQSLIRSGYAIVVVDDGSRDGTWQTLAIPGICRLRHAINRGQGAALQTGITYALLAGADFIVTFDADGQHSVDDIPKMLAPLIQESCDVTLGSRFLGVASNIPWKRRLLLRLGVVFTGVVSGIWLTDTHNGLRAFTRDAASRISINIDGMAHASEIIHLVRRRRLRFQEVPVHVRYNHDVLQKGQSNFNALQIAFKFLTHLVTS